MATYSIEHICQILGLEENRLRYWQRLGLFPRGNDGFDWIGLSRAKTLLRLVEQEGLSARGLLPFAPILESHHLRGHGKVLVVRDGAQFREACSGQWILDLEPDIEEARVLTLYQEWVAHARQAFVEDLNDLGLLLMTTGDHDAAVKILTEATQSPEAGARQWFNLSHAFDAVSRFEESKNALEVAVKLDGHFADARFNLALAYERLGETGRAYRQWREFLKRHPLEQEAETVKLYLSKTYGNGRVIPLRGHQTGTELSHRPTCEETPCSTLLYPRA